MNNFFETSENLSNFIKNRLESNYPGSIINCKGNNLIEISAEIKNNKYEYFLNNEGNVANKNDIEIVDFTLTNKNYEMAGIIREGDIIIPSFFVNNGTYYKIICIGEQAFQDCKEIGKVEIPDTVISIGNYAFKGSSVTDIGSPKNVTNIGINAFASCATLNSVNFPNVTTIGEGAFWYSYIPSYNFPKLETIGNGAFAECRKGTRIYFPKVSNIGQNAFSFAWGINSIVLNSKATLSNKNAFRDGIIIYVNDEDLEWYSTATNWNDLYDAGKVKPISELE